MLFAAVMIFLPTGPLHAQAGGESPTVQEEKGKVSCKDVQPSGDGNSAPAEQTPDQASATKEACEEQADASGAAAPKESVFKKILRVLRGPDTPPGPNTDVDTNISAGGAAGG
jgi:hypothetical protein